MVRWPIGNAVIARF